MHKKNSSAFGSWRSPITASLVAKAARSISQIKVDNQILYWLEQFPEQQGRTAIISYSANGKMREITSHDCSVRTRAHEYGGGDFAVHDGYVYFCNDSDQRLYQLDREAKLTPITPMPAIKMAWRYADAAVSADGSFLVCVRETHGEDHEIVNELVLIPTEGSCEITVLQSGDDFYAAPQLSQDGTQLIYLSWNHPQMPWDGTELYSAVLTNKSLTKVKKIAGGETESIYQPSFGSQGEIYFVSDRSHWWNLYKYKNSKTEILFEIEAEVGYPAWIFGTNMYAVASDGTLVCIVSEKGCQRLAILQNDEVQWIAMEYNALLPTLALDNENIYCIGAGPAQAPAILRINRGDYSVEMLHSSSNLLIDAAYLSLPESIEFETEHGQTAFANYYAPHNPNFRAEDGELPPLMVICHGGPTACASSALNLKIQYWTSRGFAVVDVNYGGSTGYGREYRERLKGQWGIVDVADCVNAAKYLVKQGKVDPNKLLIKGSSAGGLTTLCALTFYDIFAAGASYYGVADLESLCSDTHKFESHYLEALIGPYPAERQRYKERSPLNSADAITTPVIFLQGLQDKVVSPAQAEAMMAALEAKGLPYAYVTFANEQHGFRDGQSISRALEAELSFYGQILGFKPADGVQKVAVKNF